MVRWVADQLVIRIYIKTYLKIPAGIIFLVCVDHANRMPGVLILKNYST